MVKFTLEIEEDYDFQLTGIFSHIKDYRLSWYLNHQLGIDLHKSENLVLKTKDINQEHSFHEFHDEENLREFFLLANRSEDGWLVPEEKCDYMLMLKGHFSKSEYDHIKASILELKHVLATSQIHVEDLKSKENLLF